jgi:hypothetical protein
MYELLNPPVASTSLGCWAKPLGGFSEVLGYSHLGSIFLRDPKTQEYLVLHPLASGSNAKRYGKFDTCDSFETGVLKDPTFVDEILHPADLVKLQERLGKLRAAEVYYPVPYPWLGGSGAISSYATGNVWVFVDLVGQSRGVGE